MRTPDDPRTPTRGFGRVSAEHAQTFIGIINVLHNGPTAPAFGRLLQKKLEADDYMMLAHIFEEFCVLALAAVSIRTGTTALALVGRFGWLWVNPAPTPIQPRLAAAGPWLDRFNAWRAATDLPALTENTTWSAGDYSHALYMVKNNLVTHYETSGTPYYTAAGDTAARNSNI